MAVSQLMTEGLNLLVIGMGTVFVFLAVMVVAVSLMSKLAHRIEARFPAPVDTLQGDGGGTTSDHIAVISAAVRRYRNSRAS